MHALNIDMILRPEWILSQHKIHDMQESSQLVSSVMSASSPNFQPSDIERELESMYPTIYRMVSAMVWGSGLDAEDLTQDVFLKAYRNASSFNRESALSTWLFRIARNTVIDAQRRKKLRNFFTAFSLNNEHQIEPVAPGSEHDPVEQGEIVEMVRLAIASLPEPYRSMIIWREIEELPYSQIMEITGESEGTLKSRLFYAKKKLKDILVKKGFDYEI